MHDYPRMIADVDRIEPVPRRVRGLLAGQVVFDTTSALYVWERPHYPQYYIPLADVRTDLLVDENHQQHQPRGTAHRHGLRVGALTLPGAAQVYRHDAIAGLADTVRFAWSALDSWYEEDEEVFVHPRNPYTRVDALRSTRRVRVERDGVLLAESSDTVMLFETGLPTRYYFDPSDVDFRHLVPSHTTTECPYKGTTTGYWSVHIGATVYEDLAWCYDYPVAAVGAIAGLVAFYNEKVDVTVDGQLLERPATDLIR